MGVTRDGKMKTFKELTRDEKLSLYIAGLDGIPIDIFCSNYWRRIEEPSFVNDCCYRISPTKPSINWDHVHPDYVAMATNKGGFTHLISITNIVPIGYGWKTADNTVLENCTSAFPFASFKPGTCDWKDSLVVRPGYEEEAK